MDNSLLIYFSKGCYNLNCQSQLPNESKLENGLYMDEAISKISKKSWTSFEIFCLTIFFHLEIGFLNYLLVFLSGMTLFATIVEIVGIMYVFPVSQCDLNLTSSEKGMLGAAAPLGIISSSHLWGYLGDTKGRRAVMIPTLFMAFLSSVCASFMQNIFIFTILRFWTGFL